VKYLIWTGILLAGLLIGYLIGNFTSEPESVNDSSDKAQTEFITEYIRDTVVHEERIEIPVLNDSLAELDSLSDSTRYFPDSSFVDETKYDTSDISDLNIRREKKIEQLTLPIIYLTESGDKDTLLKDMLGITENRTKSIVVEFWESPLSFLGYKLSRKKLVVYGLSPQHDYSIYRKEKYYYLSAREVFYAMQETQEFKNFIEVSKDVVFND
jgi:hypothetical protein